MGLFSFFNSNKQNSKNQTPKTLLKPDFGEININNLEDYYDSTTKLDHREISIDINFETKSISQWIQDNFLCNLETSQNLSKPLKTSQTFKRF